MEALIVLGVVVGVGLVLFGCSMLVCRNLEI